MADSGDAPTIDVVRDQLSAAVSGEVLTFWAAHAALPEAEAHRRLSEVVCVMRRGGAVVGVSSAFAAAVPMVGGQRFWIYRNLLDEALVTESDALLRATFGALEAGFDRAAGSPIGLCLLDGDLGRHRRRPDAQWIDPPMTYAGYLQDGRQVRVGYFAGARVRAHGIPATLQPYVHGAPLPGGHRIELFAEQDAVAAGEVIDLWTREGALDPDQAQQRISEILLVATDGNGQLAGVATTYLRRNDQLRAQLWHVRTYIAQAHRRSLLSTALSVHAREHYADRFARGLDQRGIGVLYEIESEVLRRGNPYALWRRTGSVFVGVTPLGADVRVRYFPGARAPEPG